MGYDIPVLLNHLHTDFPGGDGGPWQLPYITRGAFREDEEDPIYNFYLGNPPPLYSDPFTLAGLAAQTIFVIINEWTGWPTDYFVSVTHFWDVDKGDTPQTVMHAKSLLTDFYIKAPNAYQKLMLYVNGGWDLNVDLVLWNFPINPDGSGYSSAQRAIVTFHYNSLVDLYKNKNLYVTKVTWITGQQVVYNNPIKFMEINWSSLNDGNYNMFLDNIVFETLGRMCHLLEDMSVPEHVHVDEHGNFSRGSDYEDFMKDDRYWDYINVNSAVGSFINPYISSSPLHFLMYTTAQISDHFGSNGPYEGDGDDNLGGNPLPEELAYLNSLNISSFGQPTGMTYPIPNNELINIRDKLMPQAIRATAGLLYWFATEAGIMPQPNTINFQNNFPGQGNGGNIIVNGNQLSSPTSNFNVVAGYPITASALTQTFNNIDFYFSNWSNGSQNISETFYPSTNTTYTANFIGKPANGNKNQHFNDIPGQNVIVYWDQNPNTNVTKYNIYRKVKHSGVMGPEFQIASINRVGNYPYTYSYTDYDYTITSSYTNDLVLYDVRQYYAPTTSYSDPTFLSIFGVMEAAPNLDIIADMIVQNIKENSIDNYPNPFNPSTVIRYQIVNSGHVTLKVYDALGREVITLVDKEQASGRYEVNFNTSSVGGELSSGLYIYKITANGFSAVKKMILTK